MSDVDSMKQALNKKTTEELLTTYADNKREEWTDGAFTVMADILRERGAILPQQKDHPVKTKKISPYVIPNSLGIAFAAATQAIDGLTRSTAGLLGGGGYILGIIIGYVIVQSRLETKMKTRLAWAIGIIVIGGLFMYLSNQKVNALYMPTP